MMDGSSFVYYGEEAEKDCGGSTKERACNEFHKTSVSANVWDPRHFRSSKTHKAVRLSQSPSDYMDDEDVGVFGIAPQNIRIKESFGSMYGFTREKTDYSIWEDDYPRVIWDKNLNLIVKNLLEQAGWAGDSKCDVLFNFPKDKRTPISTTDASTKQHGVIRSTDHEILSKKLPIRNRSYGLGYEGLKRENCVTLFGTGHMPKKLKCVTPAQSFFMGVLEEDDEEVYGLEDTNKYDFYLESRSFEKLKLEKNNIFIERMGGFSLYDKCSLPNKNHAVFVPPHFKPRKIRFELVKANPNQNAFSTGIVSNSSVCRNCNSGQMSKPVKSFIFEGGSLPLKQNVSGLTAVQSKKRTNITKGGASYRLSQPLKLIDERFISEFDIISGGSKNQLQYDGKAKTNRMRNLWSPHDALCKRFKIFHESSKETSAVTPLALAPQKRLRIIHQTKNESILFASNTPSTNFFFKKTCTGKCIKGDICENPLEEETILQSDELYIRRKTFIFKENDLFGLVFGESKNVGKGKKDLEI